MRKNISNVIEAFKNNRRHSEKTCSTDGTEVYSYNMLIAFRRHDQIFIVNYNDAPSNTTRSQVRALTSEFRDHVAFAKGQF